jgi:hypothetical protein
LTVAVMSEREYGTIIVVGGGCYGSYYVRQLLRAREAGALAWRRVVVVDRDAGCRVARLGDVEVVVAEWGEFFREYLGGAGIERDAVVPSPLMPHLFFEWVRDRARARWPGRRVEAERYEGAGLGEVPWQRTGDDGTHYVSFATWMCPVNCIEPAKCPHTKGPRDWSMPVALSRALTEPVIFHCTHRAYGVGMIDTADLLAGDARVASAGTASAARVIVGTVSHCHGALSVLSVD